MAKEKMKVVNISAELHRRMKRASGLDGVNIRKFCEYAIETKVNQVEKRWGIGNE